jgi:hypothetical protein
MSGEVVVMWEEHRQQQNAPPTVYFLPRFNPCQVLLQLYCLLFVLRT